MNFDLRTSLAIALAIVAVGLSASVAGAEVYRYVDDNGVPHYSDSVASIPSRYRDQVADISGELEARPGINVIPGMNAAADDEAGSGLAESSDFDIGDERTMGAVAEQLWDRFGVLLIVGVLLLIPISFVLSGLVLMLAFKLAASDTPGFGRALTIVFVQGLAGAAINGAAVGVGLALGITDDGSATSLAFDLASALACFAAYAGVLWSMSDLGFPRALWVTLAYILLVLVLLAAPIAIVLLLIVL